MAFIYSLRLHSTLIHTMPNAYGLVFTLQVTIRMCEQQLECRLLNPKGADHTGHPKGAGGGVYDPPP